jgi:hypothetical protein
VRRSRIAYALSDIVYNRRIVAALLMKEGRFDNQSGLLSSTE